MTKVRFYMTKGEDRYAVKIVNLHLMGKRIRYGLILLCLATLCGQAGAAVMESNLSYRRFTTLDALPQMQTETVWQDSRGYIYIGTLSGFVRYDGLSMKTFLGGQRENIVMFREAEGKVRAMGFVRQWRVKGDEAEMSQIDPTGGLLLNNLNAADLPADYVLLEDRQEQNRVLCRLGDDGPARVLESPVLDDMTPDRKLYLDSTGVYIPTPRGLYAAQDGKVRELSDKPDVFSLIRTGGGLYAIATDGIYRLAADSLALVCAHRFEAPDYGISVRENQQGELLLADSHTIWRYGGTADEPLHQLATGFNLIRGIFIDKWNRLWAATYQGAYCFFHCNFTNHRLTDRNDIARAIAFCDGQQVLGTLNGKVIANGQLISELDGNFYAPGAVTLGDRVYLAGNGDVASVQGSTLQWLGLPDDRYRFVAGTADRLIIGTLRSVLEYDPASGRLDTLSTGIAHPWCAAPGTQGRLWVSGNPGLYCLTQEENGGISAEKLISTPTTPVITAMAADDRGRVCYALGDALYLIRDEQISPITELNAILAGHEIRSLHISPRGYLVVAAIDGLLVASLDADGRTPDFHWFDARNGFTTIEPLMGAMAESEDGTVWLAGLEDMISFRPAELLSDNRQSTVVEKPLPWWQRWWAILIAVALLSAVVWELTRWSVQRQTRKKMARLEREKAQKELQLRAVRLKAIPHFHSNVLSSIEYFVMNKSSDEASYYLKLYSDFTNQTLTDIDRPARPVSGEVDYVRRYLELEQLRYGERLQYRINVAPDVDQNILLPTMLLHTYCQNAVKHGIASKAGVGTVEVTVSRQQRDGADGVLVSVRDDGVGRAEAARSGKRSTGQGLTILRQQIDLYNQANAHPIVQQVTDLTDGQGRPAGTCFETWVPADYQY